MIGYCTAIWLAVAATAAPPVHRQVVIVANNGSISESLQPLRFADDDGANYYGLFAPFAQQTQLLTVLDLQSQRRFAELVEISRPPTSRELQASLQRAFSALEKQRDGRTELVFVYVGHGSLDAQGKGYVHLQDAAFTRADLFHQVINASPADYTHVIIDACNSFSLVAGRGEETETEPEGQVEHLDVVLRQFLSGNDLDDYPNVGVIAATSENRDSHEWSRIEAGLFSHVVRSGLLGAADVNRDGRIEYSELAAFVEAANAKVSVAARRLQVFAHPPARNRRATILDLRGGVGVRQIELGPEVFGHLHLQNEEAVRLADVHKARGEVMQLVVPAGQLLFLRSEAAETIIDSSQAEEVVEIAALPNRPYPIARRGAVDLAFERDLFRVPFSPAFYEGFVAARPGFVAVDFDGPAVARSAGKAEGGLGLRFAYGVGQAVLDSGFVEHGVVASLDWRVWESVATRLLVEGGYAELTDLRASGTSRVGVGLGLAYQPLLANVWRVEIGGALGWSAVLLHGPANSVDSSVPWVRGYTWVGYHVTRDKAIGLGVEATAYRINVGSEELMKLRVGGNLGLMIGL